MLNALSAATTGLQQQMARFDQAAGRIARNGAAGDLAGNLVDVIRASRGAEANVAAIRTADQTIGTLLNVFA